MTQISTLADGIIDKLARKVSASEKVIETLSKLKDKAWEEIFSTVDEFDVEDARFLSSDGRAISKQKRQGSPKLDQEKLKQLLQANARTERAFKQLWTAITTETVNPALLEAAVQRGKVPATIVNECMTVPEPSFARVRPEWTKDDKNRAVVLGVNVNPIQASEINEILLEVEETIIA